MMKKRIGIVILLSVLALTLGAYVKPADEISADLYFENGVIYTVDNSSSIAEGLAVKDGVIVFVGSAADGKAYREAAADNVDLQGGMLMPGFIDTHIHTASMEMFDFNLSNVLDLDKVLTIIEDYVKAHPDQESYSGYGYAIEIFEGEEDRKGPRKERLDAICSDKPMYIFAEDGHSAWLNTKCLEQQGITKDTKFPPGGEVVLDDNTGELWGTLKDGAMSLAPNPSTDAETLSKILKNYQSSLNSKGYTTIFAPEGNGFLPMSWEGFAALDAQDELTLRIRGSEIITTWATESDIKSLKDKAERYNSELLKLTTAKFFIDGGLANKSALLLEPYVSTDFYGPVAWPQDKLNETVATVNKMGIQAHFHTMTDGAVRSVLDATEYAQSQGADPNCRNIMAHLQMVAPEDFARFAELNVLASAQPYWHLKSPNFWEPIEMAMVGPERGEKLYPLKSFLEHDVHVSFGSDFPVTSNPEPFAGIQGAITRNLVRGSENDVPDITDMDDPQYLLWPEERVGLEEAIRCFTAEGAYAVFEEDTIGTLEVGKSADLVVLDRNLLEVEPMEIKNTKVRRTYLQGKLVYQAE